LDGSGEVSRDATNTDSDAGIAYAKVKAVYPQKTREMLAQANPKDLANESAVRGILGTTKILKEETAKELYRRMQHFVDSKEKSTGPANHRKKVNIPMEYWPLIKVVRIFTKANALSTGAVIVDLVSFRNLYGCFKCTRHLFCGISRHAQQLWRFHSSWFSLSITYPT
jgi:neutral trehalase